MSPQMRFVLSPHPFLEVAMNDFFRWFCKVMLHLIFWVFILSIKWDGRTMFHYANDVLVQNAFVEAVDHEMGDLWHRLSKTAEVTFSDDEPEDERKM